MYYKQSTKQVKLIIMSFDDVMFDLTRLRYNYYRRLCKLYNVTLNKADFLKNQGSCRTMFKNCPIDTAILNQENMISKIEEDLFTYSQMYGMKHRDGLVELMELFRQKKIQCVVTSTHPKIYTERLFNLAALYHQPTELVYDDECQDILPDPKYYQNILDKYNVAASEVLLIASHKQAVEAANLLRMNVIGVPGLEEPSKEMEIRCLKVVTSLLEIINIILEGRIAPLSDQYLLIRHDGGTQDLYHNYQHLRDVYRDDYETLSVIETIYQDEFSRAQKASVEQQIKSQEDIVEANPQPPVEVSVLQSLESVQNSEENENITTLNETLNQKIQEASLTKNNVQNDLEEKTDIKPNNPLDALQDEIDPTLTLSALDSSAKEKTETSLDTNLLNMIEEVTQTDIPPIKDDVDHTKIFTKEELKVLGIKEEDLFSGEEDFEDEDEEVDQPSLIVSYIVNIGYAIMDAIMLVLFTGVMMVGLNDWLSSPNSFFYFIHKMLIGIGDISVKLFGPLMDTLTSFFNTSAMFNGFLAVILFVSIILWIGLNIISTIKKFRTKQ